MGKGATVGLAPAVFGPWMNIPGSILANYWRRVDAPALPDLQKGILKVRRGYDIVQSGTESIRR